MLAKYLTGEGEFPSSVLGRETALCGCHSRRVALSSDRSRLTVQRAQHRGQSPRYAANCSAGRAGGLGPRRELVNGPSLTLAFGYANSFFGLRPSRKPAPLRPFAIPRHWQGVPRLVFRPHHAALVKSPGGLLFLSPRRPIPPSATPAYVVRFMRSSSILDRDRAWPATVSEPQRYPGVKF